MLVVEMIRLSIAVLASGVGLLLLLPILIMGLPFAIVTLLTRWLAGVIESPHVPWRELIEYDAALGWRSKPNMKGWHLVDDVFRLSTDGDGWRGKTGIAESDLLVIGDSFAWGYGIDDSRFFADLNPKLRVKAIGTIGYSMVQEVLCLEQLAPRLRGKVAVWLIYLANDLYDNLVPNFCWYRRPWVKQINASQEWEIVKTHVAPTRWPFAFEPNACWANYHKALADISSGTILARRAYSASEWLLRRGRDICQNAGASLAVMSIPDATQMGVEGVGKLRRLSSHPESFDPDRPDRELRGMCEKLGVPFIAGREYLQLSDYKESDCHWNEQGHRRVAQLLKSIYDSPKSSRELHRREIARAY